jgi:hypothetical protein
MYSIKLDKKFKRLSRTCHTASEAIKAKIDQNVERKRRLANRAFLKDYQDEIPLVRASLKNISIEQSAKELKENNT